MSEEKRKLTELKDRLLECYVDIEQQTRDGKSLTEYCLLQFGALFKDISLHLDNEEKNRQQQNSREPRFEDMFLRERFVEMNHHAILQDRKIVELKEQLFTLSREKNKLLLDSIKLQEIMKKSKFSSDEGSEEQHSTIQTEEVKGVEVIEEITDTRRYIEEEKKPKKSYSTKCCGITAKGKKCENLTRNENGFCHLHQSQYSSHSSASPDMVNTIINLIRTSSRN
jgi:hypothetical protein